MKYIYNLAFKMSISATIALVIANLFNVQYATVAAVIAILSIQDTKKKALIVGRNRVVACIIAIFLSIGIFKILGQNPITFAIFLLIFIPLTSKFNIAEGMVPAVVLSTHLLIAGELNSYWIINELLITFIGVGIASIANLFMPSLRSEFNEDKEYIEKSYKIILYKMANSLVSYTVDIDEEIIMNELENRLTEAVNRAYKIASNNLLNTDSYYIDYMNMRKIQFDIIKKLRSHFEKFYMSFEQTFMISKFTKSVASQIKDTNDCLDLLEELEVLKEDFKQMALPKTREEFENRAQLLQFLNDMEDLLRIKRNFILNYSSENKRDKFTIKS
ncbi:aromatic acid exporter family protein [Clostridium sartagoforme]|uniref:Aromatic acid exporter family protein n=2 Tax=Clostridium TaxID=1485 RepID=A0A4S2DS11_9CLOT|nr:MULTISPECIES: aromatic acid exporter family protein [Clostridium]MBS5939808.1 aromatic acid exporter family protein [Clostridium sp.]MDU5110863.1 aromatic acid exporter family protein [Clostridium sp.]TGY43851.1 aromatic acid exporter family protein [Clostridium sartagoforme]